MSSSNVVKGGGAVTSGVSYWRGYFGRRLAGPFEIRDASPQTGYVVGRAPRRRHGDVARPGSKLGAWYY